MAGLLGASGPVYSVDPAWMATHSSLHTLGAHAVAAPVASTFAAPVLPTAQAPALPPLWSGRSTPTGRTPDATAGRPGEDPACAAPLQAGPIGLDEVVNRALCADPRTRQSWAQWRVQIAQEELEQRAYAPTASATFGTGRGWTRSQEGEQRLSGRGRVSDLAVEAAWVLYDFGQREAVLAAARQSLAAAAANHDRTVQEVYLAAAQAYFRLVEAQATVSLLEESERFTKEVLGFASRSEGDRTAIDRLGQMQARTALARLALERRQAEGALAQTRGELAVRLGGSPTVRVEARLPDPVPDTPGAAHDAVSNIDAMIGQALREHPELQEARARLGVAQAQWDGARRADRPTLSAQAGQRRSRDAFGVRDTTGSIGLQLTVPLTAWRDRGLREQQARAHLDALQAEVRDVEQQTALDVWAAYQEQKAQMQAITEARRYQITARELLTAELAAFHQGDGDMFDVLDASESVLEAARAELVGTAALRYQRLRLAAGLGRLHHSQAALPTGRLPARRP